MELLVFVLLPITLKLPGIYRRPHTCIFLSTTIFDTTFDLNKANRKVKRFPHLQQLNDRDGGAACLYMITRHFGRQVSLPGIRTMIQQHKAVNALTTVGLVAEQIGLSSMPAQLTFPQLRQHAPLPCLVRWYQNRIAVVYRITRRDVYVADPAQAQKRFRIDDFLRRWADAQTYPSKGQGEVLLLEPNSVFFEHPEIKPPRLRLRLPFSIRKPWFYFSTHGKLDLRE